MRLGSRAVRLLVIGVLSLLSPGAVGADPVPLFPGGPVDVRFSLREAQPDIPNAGRVNAIAVRPSRENDILVGTESGGMFRSTDGGANWRHVDAFRPWGILDVQYLPGSSEIVLATSGRGFDPARSGGIWRSTNGGGTWSRPPTSVPPAGSRCPADQGAFRLSFEPGSARVYASTECGVAVSDDGGETWLHRNVGFWPLPTPPVISVQALGDGRAIAAGISGAYRTVDGGRRWDPAGLAPPRWILSPRALSPSPSGRDEAYVLNHEGRLYVTPDAGQSWWPTLTRVAVDDGCGGFEFVHVVPSETVLPDPGGLFDLRGLDVYLSNRCFVYKSTARRSSRRIFPSFSRTWTLLEVDHADTRVLAFGSDGRPRFLGTDGGFHVTDDAGAHWRYAGGSRAGLGALQLYEVTGQRIETPPRTDLYIGSQDNNLWSTRDRRSWPYVKGAEGFSIFVEPRIARAVDSRVTYKRGWPFETFLSDANFEAEEDWPDAQPGYSDPVLLGPARHVQHTGPVDPPSPAPDPLPPPIPHGFSVTRDYGGSWDVAIEDFGREKVHLPKLARYGREDVVAYQAWRAPLDAAGNQVFKLARITDLGRGAGTARVTFPAHTGFRSLGVHPAQFIWAQVFGVDPQDPMHLIAPDVGDGRMKRSRDGGGTWTPMDALTGLVTAGGTRPFTLDFGDLPFPAVTAVSFCPDDPNLVLVGTWDSGLFLSIDRGETWRPVPGSERLPRTMRVHWVTAGTIYIATWGRGLWELSLSIRFEPPFFTPACGKCSVYDLAGNLTPQPAFERAVVLHDGRMTDAHVEQGKLLAMAATPGTLPVLFSGLKDDEVFGIEDRGDQGPFLGLDVARKLSSSGLVLRGVTFLGGQVAGVIASPEETTIRPPGPFNEYKDEGDPTPPGVQGKPYLQVDAGSVLSGIRILDPSGEVEVSGQGFAPGGRHPVELLLDGRPVAGKRGRVKKDGTFRLRLKLKRELPLLPGLHSLAAVQRIGQQTLMDAIPFGVAHEDKAEPPPSPEEVPPPGDNVPPPTDNP